MTQFSSSSDFKDQVKNQVYWFRDYWSDRKSLGRNRKPEGLGWKNEEFDIESLGPGEFEIEKNADGSTSAKDLEKKQIFLGLADPVDLIRQYEPRNIIVRAANELSRSITNQAPHEFFWARAPIADYLKRKLGLQTAQADPPASVQEEPVASMISDLKRFALFNPLINYPIGLIGALLLFEFALNSALLLKIIIYAGVALFIVLLYSASARAVRHFFYYLPIVFFIFFLGIWLSMIIVEYIFTFLPFLKILFYISLGWKFVMRMTDEIVADVIKTYRMVFLYNGEEPANHYSNSEDVPNWLGSKPYWVFRYLFLWHGEFTFHRKFPLFHFKPDWERVEVWSDAQTGVVEFIVSDYHWRELWYKTEQGLDRIYVWALPNFHTLRPLTIKIENGQELRDLYDIEHSLYQKWHNHYYEKIMERERILAPKVSQFFLRQKKLTRYPRPILNLVLRFKKLDVVKITLVNLWWTYLRYFPEAEDKKH